MRELQEYLTPPPTPILKRETSLIIDEETRKKQQDKFIKDVIDVCKKYGIEEAFTLIITLGNLEKYGGAYDCRVERRRQKGR